MSPHPLPVCAAPALLNAGAALGIVAQGGWECGWGEGQLGLTGGGPVLPLAPCTGQHGLGHCTAPCPPALAACLGAPAARSQSARRPKEGGLQNLAPGMREEWMCFNCNVKLRAGQLVNL